MKYNISTYKKIVLLFVAFLFVMPVYSQQPDKPVKQLTREDVLHMSYEELLNLPFQELINLANIVGVSTEELLQMILNKNVSTASKMKETVFDSPLSTSVLNKEEIQASGARSIAEVFRMVPGMIVREKTTGNYDLHIRGNDNIPAKNMFVYSEDAMSLVMIDNRPVYNYSFGGTFWESLPIDINDIERIEVIRGPSSALYGPNAVAGVINIITQHPDSKRLSTSGNIQAGTQNTKIANLGVSGGIGDKFKFRVSGNYKYAERFDDKFYVFDLNQYLTYDQMDTLTTWWDPLASRRLEKAEGNFKEGITSKNHATDNCGANAFLFYDVNKDVHFNLSTGVQQSYIVSTTLGNHAIPLGGRQSNTQYIDFKTKAYGFDFQTNYMWGNQQVDKGNSAWHISPSIFNSELEYEYKLKTLTLRPGISYSHTVYSDKDYVDGTDKDGFLNGDKLLTCLAGFLRADYKPTYKLRLIAALRADKYNYPNKTYFTYQFISTYSLNPGNLIRGVYSRANRGPFIVDTHADYHWKIVENSSSLPNNYTLIWSGNNNLKLPASDMFELGYRTKLGQHVMIDVEAFVTSTKDYSYFMPDSMTLTADLSPLLLGKSPTYSMTGSISYHNFDMTTRQYGITYNISVAINKQLNFNVFGSIQETRVNNFYNKTIWDDFTTMGTQNAVSFQTDVQTLIAELQNTATQADAVADIMANPTRTYTAITTISDADKVDTYNKSTPAFYGGASVGYSPFEKLSIFATAYYYSNQTIMTNKVDVTDNKDNKSYFAGGVGVPDMYKVKAKIIPTLKISYKIRNENSIYLNARNFLNNTNKEFAYTDKIGATYLVGVNFNF
jgi:iron complex outermembrane recepter protein